MRMAVELFCLYTLCVEIHTASLYWTISASERHLEFIRIGQKTETWANVRLWFDMGV
jgi:hypothetical protein